MTAKSIEKSEPTNEQLTDTSDQKQLRGLANLLLIQTRFRRAVSLKELAFIAVNDTRLLVNYQSAVCFLRSPRQKKKTEKCLLAASDVPEIDINTPYSRWLAGLFNNIIGLKKNSTTSFSYSELKSIIDADISEQWHQNAPDHVLWIPINYENDLIGGMLVFRVTAWQESEIHVLNYLHETLNHSSLSLLSRPTLSLISRFHRHKNHLLLMALIIIICFQFIPINLMILAPAKVIAKDPFVLRSPLDGTIETIYVDPNTPVEPNDILISLDKSALKTQLEIAAQSQVIVEAELRQAQQSAFNDIEAKSLLPLLKLKLEKSRLEVAYTKSLLERSDIRSDRQGITLFSTKNELIGRSVQLGERIMSVADPKQGRLEIYLPVGDDIELKENNAVRFFLSASPDKKIEANLANLAYEAQEHEGSLVYKIHADFNADNSIFPRIGQRGVARIKSKEVTLFYYVFRRPISFLRQKFGW